MRTILIAAGAVLSAGVTQAAPEPLEEVLVVARPDTRTYELAETRDIAPDAAALLKRAVGANVVSNGPMSNMAQVRGMSRMRVSSRINGQTISPAGPNWMDAPLGYAPAAQLETLEVRRGVVPVSAGMETIGGVVDATTWRGEFAEEGSHVTGRLRAGTQSVNDASLLSAGFAAASSRQRLTLAGMTERADDARFPDGVILPTEYQRDRVDVGYGFRARGHELQVDYARQETGDAGTPALPMDIQYVEGDLFGLSYDYDAGSWRLDSSFWFSRIDHGMTNYHLRTPPADPAMHRRNLADVDNLGFALKLTLGPWRFGVDAHDETHDSDIDNPNNPLFFVRNFNGAERRLLGVFVERDWALGGRWDLELGARLNRIESDAGEVDATPAVMGMPPAVALRDAFNATDRSVSDTNVDLAARLTFTATDVLSYHLGAARKTRAPSYQERYLWLPLEATAGLADGRTYTGDVDLDSEVAREVEAGFDLHTPRLRVAPRVFYRDIRDYIQGGTSTNTAALMLVRMLNMMNGTSNPNPLEFQNVDAELYGADVDWSVTLAERWSLGGVVSYVRGKSADGDDLYRIPPLNGLVSVDYGTRRWGLSGEAYFAADQNRVARFNDEPETDGYVTFNLRGFWQASGALRLSAGVDNLTDRSYADHLAGRNRVRGNPDIAVGERLPGYGRNFFARLDLAF